MLECCQKRNGSRKIIKRPHYRRYRGRGRCAVSSVERKTNYTAPVLMRMRADVVITKEKTPRVSVPKLLVTPV